MDTRNMEADTLQLIGNLELLAQAAEALKSSLVSGTKQTASQRETLHQQIVATQSSLMVVAHPEAVVESDS